MAKQKPTAWEATWYDIFWTERDAAAGGLFATWCDALEYEHGRDSCKSSDSTVGPGGVWENATERDPTSQTNTEP